MELHIQMFSRNRYKETGFEIFPGGLKVMVIVTALITLYSDASGDYSDPAPISINLRSHLPWLVVRHKTKPSIVQILQDLNISILISITQHSTPTASPNPDTDSAHPNPPSQSATATSSSYPHPSQTAPTSVYFSPAQPYFQTP